MKRAGQPNHNQEMWVPLVEKAYAKLHPSQQRCQITTTTLWVPLVEEAYKQRCQITTTTLWVPVVQEALRQTTWLVRGNRLFWVLAGLAKKRRCFYNHSWRARRQRVCRDTS